MVFRYNTYEQYLKAYTYLVRVLEGFTYERENLRIDVMNPDQEMINRLNSFKQ